MSSHGTPVNPTSPKFIEKFELAMSRQAVAEADEYTRRAEAVRRNLEAEIIVRRQRVETLMAAIAIQDALRQRNIQPDCTVYDFSSIPFRRVGSRLADLLDRCVNYFAPNIPALDRESLPIQGTSGWKICEASDENEHRYAVVLLSGSYAGRLVVANTVEVHVDGCVRRELNAGSESVILPCPTEENCGDYGRSTMPLATANLVRMFDYPYGAYNNPWVDRGWSKYLDTGAESRLQSEMAKYGAKRHLDIAAAMQRVEATGVRYTLEELAGLSDRPQ